MNLNEFSLQEKLELLIKSIDMVFQRILSVNGIIISRKDDIIWK